MMPVLGGSYRFSPVTTEVKHARDVIVKAIGSYGLIPTRAPTDRRNTYAYRALSVYLRIVESAGFHHTPDPGRAQDGH